MIVCESCLERIQEHEGKKMHRRLTDETSENLRRMANIMGNPTNSEGEPLIECEWCEEMYSDFELFEMEE